MSGYVSLGFGRGFEDGFVNGCGVTGDEAGGGDGNEFFTVVFGWVDGWCRRRDSFGGGWFLLIIQGSCRGFGIVHFCGGRGRENGWFPKVHALP